MDIDRLMRISNVLSSEKDQSEAIRFLALNVCSECLPTIVYISKITPQLKLEHHLSFGVTPENLEATRLIDASLVPEFNKLISNDEILIRPLDGPFLLQFKGTEFQHRPGWRSVVIFSILNTFLVTITFQIDLKNDEVNHNYFGLLRGLLGVYLSHSEGVAPTKTQTHPVKLKQELLGKPLTSRQQEILVLIKEGLTNVSIAAKLGFSESLIKQDTITIYQKLGIEGRKEILID